MKRHFNSTAGKIEIACILAIIGNFVIGGLITAFKMPMVWVLSIITVLELVSAYDILSSLKTITRSDNKDFELKLAFSMTVLFAVIFSICLIIGIHFKSEWVIAFRNINSALITISATYYLITFIFKIRNSKSNSNDSTDVCAVGSDSKSNVLMNTIKILIVAILVCICIPITMSIEDNEKIDGVVPYEINTSDIKYDFLDNEIESSNEFINGDGRIFPVTVITKSSKNSYVIADFAYIALKEQSINDDIVSVEKIDFGHIGFAQANYYVRINTKKSSSDDLNSVYMLLEESYERGKERWYYHGSFKLNDVPDNDLEQYYWVLLRNERND